METIVVELMVEDKKLVDELICKNSENIQLLNSRRFQGEPETIQLLITLSPVIIPSLASIIITFIRSKKHISIKYKGIEIKGVSEATIIQILEKLISDKK